MSKKQQQQDNTQLIAELDALTNKELHYKCVEYGMNVPVADSTRDVIIRKLVKSITGTAVATPKANKKLAQAPASPNERRKTVNLTVHVSDDDEDVAVQQLRATGRGAAATKAKPRTQSPKAAHVNVSSTTTTTNRRSVAVPTVTSTTATAAAIATTSGSRKQPEPRTINTMRADANANIGSANVGGRVTRIVPMEVELGSSVERGDYSFEMRRSDSASKFGANIDNSNRDGNFNQSIDSNRLYNAAYSSPASTLSSSSTAAYQSLSSTSLPQHTVQPNTSFLSGYTQPQMSYQQQQQQQQRQRDMSPTAPQQPYGYNRPIGFNAAGEPKNSFSRENIASHSSSLAGVSMRNSFDGLNTTSGINATPETVFKRPAALSKTSVTTASYNQEDAQRLYPRLPTEINTPYISSSAATTPERLTPRSAREPSLSKSGVLTTSYHQEMTPPSEVLHRDEEYQQDDYEDDIDDADGDGNAGGDYAYNTSSGYDRGKYLATTQRRTDQLPFEPRLQSTFRNNLNAATRYTEPLTKPQLSPTLGASYKSNYTATRPSTTSHTSYTNSVDEPDSPSEDEVSAHESDVDEYVAGIKKMYSSYGSNKYQERVPYRRSNVANLSGSATAAAGSASHYGAYNESTITARRHTLNADEDDVNATFLAFLQTLDRKYHIRQWFYMFLLFTAAVFVYVFFVQSDDGVIPMHLAKTQK